MQAYQPAALHVDQTAMNRMEDSQAQAAEAERIRWEEEAAQAKIRQEAEEAKQWHEAEQARLQYEAEQQRVWQEH